MTLHLPRCESGRSRDAIATHTAVPSERLRVGQDGWGGLQPGVCDSRIDFAAGDGVENLDLQPYGADEGIIKICF
jgi:hypothetical protein